MPTCWRAAASPARRPSRLSSRRRGHDDRWGAPRLPRPAPAARRHRRGCGAVWRASIRGWSERHPRCRPESCRGRPGSVSFLILVSSCKKLTSCVSPVLVPPLITTSWTGIHRTVRALLGLGSSRILGFSDPRTVQALTPSARTSRTSTASRRTSGIVTAFSTTYSTGCRTQAPVATTRVVGRWRGSSRQESGPASPAPRPAGVDSGTRFRAPRFQPFVIAAFDQRFTPVAFVMVSLFCLAIHFYGLLPWKQSSGLAEEVTANVHRVSIY